MAIMSLDKAECKRSKAAGDDLGPTSLLDAFSHLFTPSALTPKRWIYSYNTRHSLLGFWLTLLA
jgi:hypothetical protein